MKISFSIENVHLLKVKLLLGKDDIDEFININKGIIQNYACVYYTEIIIDVFKFSH